jgi:hypothetical protein
MYGNPVAQYLTKDPESGSRIWLLYRSRGQQDLLG